MPVAGNSSMFSSNCKRSAIFLSLARRRRATGLRATMRARRLRGASATSSSTSKGSRDRRPPGFGAGSGRGSGSDPPGSGEGTAHYLKIWADGGYQGEKLASALRKLGIESDLEIVKKPKDVNGFTILHRRWVVERTFAWMSRCRRLAKDCEWSLERSLAWAQLATCRLMMRRIGRAATC